MLCTTYDKSQLELPLIRQTSLNSPRIPIAHESIKVSDCNGSNLVVHTTCSCDVISPGTQAASILLSYSSILKVVMRLVRGRFLTHHRLNNGDILCEFVRGTKLPPSVLCRLDKLDRR